MLPDPRFITLDAQAKARLSQRRKCVVCSALRLAQETFPFTQRAPQCAGWCKSIYPKDPKAEQKLYRLVVRAVDPALCREHFDPRCFTDKHELRAYAVPTLPKGNTTAAVMKLLRKAKAELARILPGNFIPREDTWLRIEREDSFDKNTRSVPVASPKRNRCAGQPMNNGAPKEESHIYASSSRGNEEIKKEEDDCDMQDWSQANAASSKMLATPGPSNDGESTSRTAATASKRRTVRPRKSYSPPPSTRRTRAESIGHTEDAKVTTRSGRLVKRKNFDVHDAPQPLCGGQPKRSRGEGRAESAANLHVDAIMQLRPAPGLINPITGEITPYEEDVKPDVAQLAGPFTGTNSMVVVKKEEEVDDGYPADSFEKEPFGNWKDFKKQKMIDHIAHDHCYYA